MTALGKYGFAEQWGWHPPKKPGNYANSGGGLAYNPHASAPPAPAAGNGMGGPVGPPTGTFDPALEAQRRAAQRGMHDTLADINTKRHFGERDLASSLRDITTTVKRNRQKLGRDFGRQTQKLDTEFQRGNEKIGNSEADTRLKAARTQEDLQTKRKEVVRQFGELGQRQGEAANANGVNDTGTAAASAAARARNQQIAEAPIGTAEGRLSQDLATALGRLGTARGQLSEDRGTDLSQLGQDYGTATSQLRQDRDREREGAHRDFNRENFELGRKAQRTKREGAISNVDLLEEEIWQAQHEHPGAFANLSPGGPGAPSAPSAGAPAPAIADRFPAPRRKKRRS